MTLLVFLPACSNILLSVTFSVQTLVTFLERFWWCCQTTRSSQTDWQVIWITQLALGLLDVDSSILIDPFIDLLLYEDELYYQKGTFLSASSEDA